MVEEEVNRLGVEKLREMYAGVGSPAHPPDLMLKMVLFEYLDGRTSPAQWFRDVKVHDALKWLGRGLQPSRSVWYAFRDRMYRVIQALNDELIRNAVREGLAAPVDVAHDGTTFRSHASRHRCFNQQTLQKRKAKLAAVIAADEQGTPLSEPRPIWMPPTRRGCLELHSRMEISEHALQAKLKENQKKTRDRRRPEKNIFVSLTDPEAGFARDKEKTFCFLYTAQFMVDCQSLLILGYSVSPENTDVGTLPPMIDKVQSLIGGTLKRVMVDAGYTSLLDLVDCHARDIDLLGPVQSNSFTEKKQQKGASQFSKADFVWSESEQTFRCPAGHKLAHEYRERIKRHAGRQIVCHRFRCSPKFCSKCPLKDRCTKSPEKGRSVRRLEREELLDAQRAKMQLPENKEAYRKRGQIVERPFADAKGHRNFGKLHGRGLRRARTEVGILVLALNVLGIHRLRKNAPTPGKQTT